MIARVLKFKGVELALSLDEHVAARLRAVKRAVRGNHQPARVAASVGSPVTAPTSPEAVELLERVQGIEWYHTMDLGHGVITPGFFDHRPVMGHYHLPQSLAGKRVLDVATYNGYWAFEFERRGAAEVIATDIDSFNEIDLSPVRRASMSAEQLNQKVGTGFQIAHAALKSRVKREVVSVYELSPESIGTFDMVMCSDLLLHLTNPVRALQRIRTVTRGYALIVDMYDPYLDRAGRNLFHYRGGIYETVWWTFSLTGLEQMIRDAGFSRVTMLDRFALGSARAEGIPPRVIFRADV
jgi:tRNA (mo5U34)-methyltransferase